MSLFAKRTGHVHDWEGKMRLRRFLTCVALLVVMTSLCAEAARAQDLALSPASATRRVTGSHPWRFDAHVSFYLYSADASYCYEFASNQGAGG